MVSPGIEADTIAEVPTVLRPARPGTAFIAARTGVPVLPMGFSGMTEVFPTLRQGRRATATFGPKDNAGAPVCRAPALAMHMTQRM